VRRTALSILDEADQRILALLELEVGDLVDAAVGDRGGESVLEVDRRRTGWA
jgi:hypothetical protein